VDQPRIRFRFFSDEARDGDALRNVSGGVFHRDVNEVLGRPVPQEPMTPTHLDDYFRENSTQIEALETRYREIETRTQEIVPKAEMDGLLEEKDGIADQLGERYFTDDMLRANYEVIGRDLPDDSLNVEEDDDGEGFIQPHELQPGGDPNNIEDYSYLG
jgi:hypothetical protein